jgi:putative pyruvate formate lyase activating enzyme
MHELDIALTRCNLCPRQCGVNRTIGELGYCNTNSNPLVASITIHHGEEPVLSGSKGICNVFFAHCNLRCSYCQNHQISCNTKLWDKWIDNYDIIIRKITDILDQGIGMLGFVSPSHQVPQMVKIIEMLNQQGYKPRVVYNTNSYDTPATLRMISDYVDVYLPDLKYFDNHIAAKYSDAQNYYKFAREAIREMIWQKGTTLTIDDAGLAENGVIVRHLILPGHTKDSITLLQELSEISNNITISLMSQYHPTSSSPNEIGRSISKKEYDTVVHAMDSLGFYKGWIQNLDSNGYYLPNFDENKPFKE